MTPRDLALAALNSLETPSRFPRQLLENAFRDHPELSRRDRAFTQHLVQGVLRWKLRLDWIVRQAVRFPFGNINPVVLNILRIALYQMVFLDRVPQSAAVNEAVNQAKKCGPQHLARFVNGILREICRRNIQSALPDPGEDRVRYLSTAYSYPPWLVEKWTAELGEDSTKGLLDAGNRIPDLVIRVNVPKTDRPGLIRRLEDEGLVCVPTPYSPLGIRIEGLGGQIADLASFREGLFQVQDEAAQICSCLLGPRAGDNVLDGCAGLGGKSTHMASMMADKGRVVALDRMHGRLISLAQNARRLGLSCIVPVAGDARSPLERLFRRPFDRVLVDGPCSGLGVLSRHPDGKWARGPEDIPRLADIQACMLQSALPCLRDEGCLLYTTCTISREENEGVVARVLRENRGIRLLHLKDRAPPWVRELVDENGFFRTLPHIHGMDGFFGALFRKIG